MMIENRFTAGIEKKHSASPSGSTVKTINEMVQ